MSQSVFCASYWRSSARITTYKLCVMGILVALQILLSRITAISVGNWLRISFGFLPNAVAGYLFGPVGGLLVAVVGDALGTLLTGQAINPGLSLATAISGLLYGLFLYKQRASWVRVTLCLLAVSLLCHFLLNTYFLAAAGYTAVSDGTDWPSFFRTLVMPVYGEGATLPAWISVCNRFIKQVVVLPINVVMLSMMLRGLGRMSKSIIRA
ncbi:MAG: folate family ECF transporter S component [Aristaeellaceae bacterium]